MTEKRLALIVASYQYEDADLRQLVAPAQDAEALTRVLSDPTIGGFEVQTLLNKPSHKVNPAIETFFADRERDDLLLLYFSGHGIKDEVGRLYLTTSDTSRRTLRTTAIPATLVSDMMRHSRSRQQVLLLDCCFSGAFARGMVVRADQDIGTGDYFADAQGQVVLTASDAMQYSFMPHHHRRIQPDHMRDITGFCAAAVGTTVRSTSARPTAPTTPKTVATTTQVFGVPMSQKSKLPEFRGKCLPSGEPHYSD